MDHAFDSAIGELQAAIAAAVIVIRRCPLSDDERNRAAGLQHLVRALYYAIARKFWQDPDFPLRRKFDLRAEHGGGNPH